MSKCQNIAVGIATSHGLDGPGFELNRWQIFHTHPGRPRAKPPVK